MPGLYGFSGNSNVSVNVGNTIGLYQQNTGNVYVVNNAITLLNTLSQAGNVNFALTDGNSKVLAYTANIGTPAGTYGDASNIPVVTVTSDGRVTGVTTAAISIPSGSIQLTGNVTGTGTTGTPINTFISATGVTPGSYGSDTAIPSIVVGLDGRITQITTNAISGGGSYGNANVAAYLPTYNGPMPNLSSINTSGNITANAGGYFIGDGSQLTNLPVQAGTYSNTNVAAYLTTATINTTGNITAANLISANFLYPNGVSILSGIGGTYSNTNVAAYLTTASINTTGNVNAANLTTAGNLTASYVKGDGSLLTNLPVQPGTYSNTNVTALLSSNTVSTINTTGNITTVASVNTNQLHTTDGIYSQGNITAPYFVGDGSSLTNIVTKLVAGANIALSPAGGQGQVTISTIGGTAPLTSTGYYGSFYDTTDQYANVATNSYTININSTIGTNGVTLVNSNAMSFSYAGVYQVAFSIQFVNFENAQKEANVWLTQNGTALSYTNSQVTIPARATPTIPGAILMTVPIVITVNAGDTVGLQWQQSSGTSGVYISSFTSGTSPTRPATPGIILYATQVTSVTGNQYGNSNVATFLSAGFGSNTITTTGLITAGNVQSDYVFVPSPGNIRVGPYTTIGPSSITVQTLGGTGTITADKFVGDGSQLTNLPVQAGTYSNANVASYLPVFGGIFGQAGATAPQVNANVVTVKSAASSGPTSTVYTANVTVADGSVLGPGNSVLAVANLTLSGGSSSPSGILVTGTGGAITATGTGTFGNVISTAGYFWANGTAYSTGGGGSSSFSGNLTGNTLSDSTNLRVLVNASPYSAPNTSTGLTSNYVNTVPVYTSGVLQSPTLNTTVGAAVSSNVAYQSGYQGTTNKTYTNFVSYAQVWPTTANTMLNQDRVRATATQLDVLLNGKTWGTMSSASQGAIVLNSQGGQTTVYGPGQAASIVGASGTVNIIPSAGSANVQYATGQYAAVQQTSGASGATASNIAYARLFAGAVSGQTGNITVQNAVGLHTFSGWVSSNVSLVTNAYAVLNEDSRSIIQTNGNLTVTGTLATTGNTRVTGYWNPSKRYANPSSGNVAVSGANMQAFQQIALAGSAGITASSNGFDTVYDFKIEQDGTGGRALTWYDASGSSNTQVYGFLNPIPNSATITRAIMSDTGLWTVNYANPTAPANTAATWRSYPGVVGAIVAISDAGGKLAYWDTTNNRWSYVFDNSAV